MPRDPEPADTSVTNVNCIPGGFDHIEEILIQKKAKGHVDFGRKVQQILESVSSDLRPVLATHIDANNRTSFYFYFNGYRALHVYFLNLYMCTIVKVDNEIP